MVENFFYNRYIRDLREDLSIWENKILVQRLSHYHSLIQTLRRGENSDAKRENALYLVAKAVPVSFDPDSPIDDLWEIHSRVKGFFRKNLGKILSMPLEDVRNLALNSLPDSLVPKTKESTSFLDLKAHIASKMLENCEFCELRCHVDRKAGKKGVCGVGSTSYYSSAFIHLGEERPLLPSGTIFFAGCNFSCVFCQNADLSRAGKDYDLKMEGIPVDGKKLAIIAEDLYKRGAYNINWVGGDPIPNLHTILDSMRFQKENICQLWNSNFYNSEESLDLLVDVIDLWLPDFKYGNSECAMKYSKIPRYWEVITRNFLKIAREGTHNIIIRHLVMPNHVECCTKPILRWIAENIKDKAVVNIMGQYHPDNRVNGKTYPEINRRPSRQEMNEAYAYADKLGIEYRSVSF